MRRSIRLTVLAIALLQLVAIACEEALRFGTLRIAVATTGGDLDLDGYTITLDSTDVRDIVSNGSILANNLSTGAHTVELKGWAANCALSGPGIQTPLVRGGETVQVGFTVSCAASGVQATITTTGVDFNPAGYFLSVDGAAAVSVPANGSLTITRMSLGAHGVRLSGLAPNCDTDSDSLSVSLVSYEVIPVAFNVTCRAVTGSLMVTTATSGAQLDADGYGVRIDAQAPVAMGLNASIFRPDLSAGDYVVTLVGVEGNCSVAESNPTTLHVTTGGLVRDTARVVFHVSCVSTLSDIRVTTATTGELGADVWSVVLDPDDYEWGRTLVIGANGVVTFDSVPEGSHVLLLKGMAGNCRADGGRFRGVTVVRNAVTDVAFNVHCSLPGRIEFTINTSGVEVDPDGYQIVVGGTRGLDVPTNGTSVLTGVYEGSYTLRVTGLTLNCDVTGPIPATISVVSDATTTVTLSVACAAAGTIAYGNSGELYTVKANGTGVTQLTTTMAYEDAPSWSPDGSRLVFQTDRDQHPEIYVMDATGLNAVRLTTGVASNFDPDWSPDGTKIVFVSERDGNPEIYVMNADGSGLQRLTNHPAGDREPAWSPDGTTIAFTSDRNGYGGIYAMNASGGNVTPLTPPVDGTGESAWSPDGTRIAFTRVVCDDYYGCSRDLYAMYADGSGVTPLASGSADQRHPAWSRDGRWVAYDTNWCSSSSCTAGSLAAIRPDGTDYRLVLDGPPFSRLAWRP